MSASMFDVGAYREELLAGLARVGAVLCSYCTPNTDWAEVRCDCKFGGPKPTGEKTGCPEIRTAYLLLENTTDGELLQLWLDKVASAS